MAGYYKKAPSIKHLKKIKYKNSLGKIELPPFYTSTEGLKNFNKQVKQSLGL